VPVIQEPVLEMVLTVPVLVVFEPTPVELKTALVVLELVPV